MSPLSLFRTLAVLPTSILSSDIEAKMVVPVVISQSAQYQTSRRFSHVTTAGMVGDLPCLKQESSFPVGKEDLCVPWEKERCSEARKCL